MSKILTEDFNGLVNEYDKTNKEIKKIQMVIEGYIGNILKGIGKLHKDASRDSRVQNFTKQIQGALKKNDDMISKAMPIVQRALKAREKALNDIEAKILKKADPELGKALKAAMDESKAKVSQFTQALDTFMKAMGPEATPAAPAAPAAPTAAAPTTPAAPAAASTATPTAPAASTPPATPAAAPAAPAATTAPAAAPATKPAPAAAPYDPNYGGGYDPSKGAVTNNKAKDTNQKTKPKKAQPTQQAAKKSAPKKPKKNANQQDEPFDSTNQGWVGEGTKK